MSQDPGHKPSHLDRYLDGQMTDAERRAFERAVRADPQLRAQLELQWKIEASLSRLFVDSGATPMLPAGGASALRWTRFRPLYWSIAAAVLLAAALTVYLMLGRGPSGAGPLAEVYRVQLAKGFTPEVVCTTSDEFAKWVNTYFGQPIYPAEQHDGVEFIGWNYAPVIGGNSGVLLARVNGREVIVVMDRKTREKKPLPPAGGGLKSFRQEFGSVVLYEVTPLEAPAILPILSTQKPAGH